MAGAPGAPGAAAARQGQGAGTTRSLDLETTSTTTTRSLDLERAVARTPRLGIARHSSNAQLMEVVWILVIISIILTGTVTVEGLYYCLQYLSFLLIRIVLSHTVYIKVLRKICPCL